MQTSNKIEIPDSFGVLGGGFGLYGYLPALLSLKEVKSIILPTRYLSILQSRDDLKSYLDRPEISFRRDDQDVVSQVSGLVIARRPEDQFSLVKKFHDQVKLFVLEKPLGRNPQESLELIDFCQENDIAIRVGFSFLYVEWFIKIMTLLEEHSERLNALKLLINWQFMAHHYRNGAQWQNKTWKSDHQAGGSVLRFYGIQLIAVLASFGYAKVVWSQLAEDGMNGYTRWQAKFCGDALPDLEIDLNSHSVESEFGIAWELGKDQFELFRSPSPFPVSSDRTDPRCSVLMRLLNDQRSSVSWLRLAEKCSRLWSDVELLNIKSM